MDNDQTSVIAAIKEAHQAIKSAPDSKKAELVDFIVRLLKKIVPVAEQFGDIPQNYATKIQPMMLKQLQAAEKRTERAADSFLSIAEELMPMLDGLPEARKKEIQEKINEMFEASSFQDLVAQHLNEIKLLVNDLTYDIEGLQETLMELGNTSWQGTDFKRSVQQKRSDAHLLNGPSTDVLEG